MKNDLRRTYVLQRQSVDCWGRSRREYLHCVNDLPFREWFNPLETVGRLRRARHFQTRDAALDYLRKDVPDAYSERFSVVHVPVPAYPFDAGSMYPFNID